MNLRTKQVSVLEQFFGHQKRASELSEQIRNIGDELEFAARVCEASAEARDRRGDESDQLRLGYAIAAAEMAVVLRAMRRGGQPTPEAMTEARDRVTAAACVGASAGMMTQEKMDKLSAYMKDRDKAPVGQVYERVEPEPLKRFVAVEAMSAEEASASLREFDTRREAMQFAFRKDPDSVVIIDTEERKLVEERFT